MNDGGMPNIESESRKMNKEQGTKNKEKIC